MAVVIAANPEKVEQIRKACDPHAELSPIVGTCEGDPDRTYLVYEFSKDESMIMASAMINGAGRASRL